MKKTIGNYSVVAIIDNDSGGIGIEFQDRNGQSRKDRTWFHRDDAKKIAEAILEAVNAKISDQWPVAETTATKPEEPAERLPKVGDMVRLKNLNGNDLEDGYKNGEVMQVIRLPYNFLGDIYVMPKDDAIGYMEKGQYDIVTSVSEQANAYDWIIMASGVVEDELISATEQEAQEWFEKEADSYSTAQLMQLRALSVIRKQVSIDKF